MSASIDRRHLELTDTDRPVADQRDHMGRRTVNTFGEAFRRDLPWIVLLLVVVTFDIMALAGWFR